MRKTIFLISILTILLTACTSTQEEYTVTYDYKVFNYGSWQESQYTIYHSDVKEKAQLDNTSALYMINDTAVRCDTFDDKTRCNLLGHGVRYIDPYVTARFMQGSKTEGCTEKTVTGELPVAVERTGEPIILSTCYENGILQASELKQGSTLIGSMTKEETIRKADVSFDIPVNALVERRGCSNESIVFMVLPWKTFDAKPSVWITDTQKMLVNETYETQSFKQLEPTYIDVPVTGATKYQSQLCVGTDCSQIDDMSFGMCQPEWFAYDQCYDLEKDACQKNSACAYDFPYCYPFMCGEETTSDTCNAHTGWCGWDEQTTSCQYIGYPK